MSWLVEAGSRPIKNRMTPGMAGGKILKRVAQNPLDRL
jgi:hypothetical protein